MKDEKTAERETAEPVALNRYKPVRDNLVTTMDEERTITVAGGVVHVVPIWKWLLE